MRLHSKRVDGDPLEGDQDRAMAHVSGGHEGSVAMPAKQMHDSAWLPKTRREARAAAHRLFGAGEGTGAGVGGGREQASPPDRRWASSTALHAHRKGASGRRGFDAPGGLIQKSRTQGLGVPKGRAIRGRDQSATDANANHRALRRAVLSLLKNRQTFHRNLNVIDLSMAEGEGNSRVLTVLILGDWQQSNDRHQPLALVSFCLKKQDLRYENPLVVRLAETGWSVSREVVETPGHAVERLEARLASMGWAQPL